MVVNGSRTVAHAGRFDELDEAVTFMAAVHSELNLPRSTPDPMRTAVRIVIPVGGGKANTRGATQPRRAAMKFTSAS